MTLLASLPFDRYQSLIVALDVAGEDNLSFNIIKALLLNEADRLADSNADSQRAVASFASVLRSKSRRQLKCYACGKKGHFAKDCRSPKKREKNVSHDPNYSRINAQVAQISEDQTEEDAGFALTVTSKYCKMDGIWIIDSGASQHMVSDQNLLQEFHVYEKPHEIKLAGNCDLIYAVGEGNIKKIKFECGEMLVDLVNVLYVPDLGDNLLSVHSMTMHGANVIFSKGVCKISARGKILGIGQKHERLFGIKVVFPDHVCVAQVKPLDDYSLELWHERMGHINKDSISKLQKVVEGISTIKKVNHCLSCAKGKQHRKPFNLRSSHSEDILDIVHTDLMGPFEIESIGGSYYICTFIDDKSRYAFVYMIRSKKEVFEKFVNFVKMMEIQTGRSIKKVRSDNGGEYCSAAMEEFCKKKGIQHQYTTPYTPEQNGVAERFNRTITENMRAMLYHAKLPKKFWAEAINTAVYLKNRSPHSYLDGLTPFEIFHGQKPNLSHLRVFGCLTTVHIPKQQRLKVYAKAKVKIFIGYPDNVKGYRLMDPESLKVTISRNVIFHEDKFLCDIENTDNNQLVTISGDFGIDCCNDDDDGDDDDGVGGGENCMVNVNQNSNVQMSRDVSEEIENLEDVSGLSQEENNVCVGATYEETFMNQIKSLPEKRPSALRPLHDVSAEHCKLAESLVSEINEPSSIKEAWHNKYGKQWMIATDSEFESLIEANTWELVPLPKNKNIVGCKWIFKVKRKADNSIDRFKARLVAQG